MSKQAIDAKRLNAFLVDPNSLVIETDHDHPLYDERIERPIDDRRVRNVMKFGILEPIIVRKDGDKVVVVDGRQRVRWARQANEILSAQGADLIMVPCMIKRGDDADLVGVMISANEQRDDDDLLVKANKVQRYLDMGRTEEEASTIFGVTIVCLRQWIKLLDLAPVVKQAVKEGKLSASAATPLSSLTREEQEAKLKELLARGGKVTASRTRVASGADKATRPGRKQIKKVAEALASDDDVKAILRWVLGELSGAEFVALYPKAGEVIQLNK